MKRWIIRNFFTGLLLLCLGGWAWSYRNDFGISYVDRKTGDDTHALWYMHCVLGKFLLIHFEDLPADEPKGWSVSSTDADVDFSTLLQYSGHRAFGFLIGFQHDEILGYKSHIIALPFWFPTAISAALLWFAWRKTRPKLKGQAFPVDAKPTTAANEANP